jgi:hypothetical protein
VILLLLWAVLALLFLVWMAGYVPAAIYWTRRRAENFWCWLVGRH